MKRGYSVADDLLDGFYSFAVIVGFYLSVKVFSSPNEFPLTTLPASLSLIFTGIWALSRSFALPEWTARSSGALAMSSLLWWGIFLWVSPPPSAPLVVLLIFISPTIPVLARKCLRLARRKSTASNRESGATVSEREFHRPLSRPHTIVKREKHNERENKPTSTDSDYRIDPSLLEPPEPRKSKVDSQRAKLLLQSILDGFKIPGKVVGCSESPRVLIFEVEVPDGVRVEKLKNISSDIARKFAITSGAVEVLNHIPGKDTVGIIVPKREDDFYVLRFSEFVRSQEFARFTRHLPLVIGKTIYGETVIESLRRIQHLLIAGATGSGKSVAVHNMIMGMLFKHSPKELKLIMVDPKSTELVLYQHIPHLPVKVVTEVDDIIRTLKWAVAEMHRRYSLLKESDSGKPYRDVAEYNARNPDSPIPYLVIVVDEFESIILAARKEFETPVHSLSSLGRAAGVHLILATQRPSTEVVTGQIKANMWARLTFYLPSADDSATILGKGKDQPNARNLTGKGDGYFFNGRTVLRVQTPLLTTEEIARVVDYLIETYGKSSYELEEEVRSYSEESSGLEPGEGNLAEVLGEKNEEIVRRVAEYLRTSNYVSISGIQTNVGVGYPKAKRFFHRLMSENYIREDPDGKVRANLEKLTD